MKRVGAHVSAEGGVFNAPLNAAKIGAKAFALWVKNSKTWFSDPFDKNTIDKFKKNLKESGISNKYILPHGSYLINLGSPKKNTEEMAYKSLVNEMNRCNELGILYLNIHPGNHLGQISEEECCKRIAENINKAHEHTENVTVVLECSAGHGSAVGYSFENLALIIDNVKDKNRVGYCIDTAHMFAAGYDIRTEEKAKKVFDKLFDTVDLKYFVGMHLNDSKTELGSRVDRHESLGKGKIGLDVFKFIMNDDRFEERPLILETADPSLWAEEIKMLYSFVK